MGMHTEHMLLDMLSPFQQIGICIEPYSRLDML